VHMQYGQSHFSGRQAAVTFMTTLAFVDRLIWYSVGAGRRTLSAS